MNAVICSINYLVHLHGYAAMNLQSVKDFAVYTVQQSPFDTCTEFVRATQQIVHMHKLRFILHHDAGHCPVEGTLAYTQEQYSSPQHTQQQQRLMQRVIVFHH